MRCSCGLFAALLCAWLDSGVATLALGEEVVVSVPQAEVRGDNRVLGHVRKATTLAVERRSGSWLLITIPGTQTQGWISDRDVRSPSEASPSIQGWGRVVNPSGDCSFQADDGRLVITVPDGLHDLWPGSPPGQSFNAPRVMQEVEGDFIAQVKVTADWLPYKSDTNYGAGLVLWDSEQHLLRRERQVFIRNGVPQCFPKPLYLQANQRQDAREFDAAAFFQGRSTWLRVQRTGQEVASAVSHDGQTWIDTGRLTTTFPLKILVGVHVFKVSPGQFQATFEDFQLSTQAVR